MEKRFISVVGIIVIILSMSKMVRADVAAVFIDDFTIPHRYHDPCWGPNVAGTIWDDYVGWRVPYESVDVLDANLEPNHPGQLYVESTNGMWDAPWIPLGPFLYKTVSGDFMATVRISDYEGDPNNWVLHNDGGLMVRACREPDVAGPGEDWICISYFPIWTCGNMLLVADDNDRFVYGHNGLEWDAHTHLRIRRIGNTFIVETSPNPDVNGWEEHSKSPLTRLDFNDLPLQVGLRQATYNITTGYVAFDDFRLEIIVEYKAHNPTPDDEAEYAPIDVNLTWSAGAKSKYHDVYFGTNETEVLIASRPVGDVDGNGKVNWLDVFVVSQQWLEQPPGGPQWSADLTGDGKINGFDFAIAAGDWGRQASDVFKGSQFTNSYNPGTLNYGTTYYWRIDEVNDPNFWTGDVWRFRIVKLEATEPSPADGAECATPHGVISWNLGTEVDYHRIYFGTDEAAVTNATPFSHPGLLLYVASYDGNSYDLGMLGFETTYYWRIDEVNFPTMWKGDTWSFTTAHYVPITDPNLVGWWKLDGTSCENIALDSSGYDRHGTLVNGPEFIAPGTMPCGMVGALSFDGEDDYVELPIGTLISSLTNSTFMMWMDSKPGGRWVRVFDFGAEDPNFYMCLGPRWYFMDGLYFAITTTDNLYQALVIASAFDLPPGWHHVAVTIDADANTAVLYCDGGEGARNSSFMLSPSDLGETVNNWLGRSHDEDDSYYWGSMADFRIYDYTMTAEDVAMAMGCIIHP